MAFLTQFGPKCTYDNLARWRRTGNFQSIHRGCGVRVETLYGNLVPAAPIGQQRERRPAAEPPAEHSAPDELRSGELEQCRPGRALCRFESQPAATAGGEAVHQQGVEELLEK
uniref:(northern house mosquito) hypothetical protein n=1 Tax=Culex pipiens TaxID=7175 RepID=A0A8D8P529_CULPI